MKKKSFSILILLCAFLKMNAQIWNLAWSDEFNAPIINPANWSFETGGGGWGNNELQNYTNRTDNATIYNGNLLVIAKKESFSGSNYTSARMITHGLHNWTYGKIEARIKLPYGKGLWPAFWMLGESIYQSGIGWPKCGEIDIMEHVNSNAQINGTIHWDNNGHAQYGGDTAVNSTQYHTYGVEWDANAIQWQLDGKKYWEANIANNINSTDEFHNPFFILLNFAVGGDWPGNPDGTTVFPDTMFVDYVRVYQKAITNIHENTSQKNRFSILSDPTGGNIILHSNDAMDGEYEVGIFDMLGKECFRKSFFSSKNEKISIPVSCDQLQRGIYILTVENNKGINFLKFVKY